MASGIGPWLPRALFIDISGTLIIDGTAIHGAVEAVKKIRSLGLPFLLVSNTSKESEKSLLKRLTDSGFNFSKDEVFSSISAARTLVDRDGLRPLLILEDDALQDFQGVCRTPDPCDAVLVGLAPSKFNYETARAALGVLVNREARTAPRLIAINKSRYLQTASGLAPGAGIFVAGLEYCSGIEAEVVGKPHKDFFCSALERLNKLYPLASSGQKGLQPEEDLRTHSVFTCRVAKYPRFAVLMVGDDVRDDVIGAQQAGLKGALVRTGKYKPGDEDLMAARIGMDDGNEPPYQVFDSLASLVDWITAG